VNQHKALEAMALLTDYYCKDSNRVLSYLSFLSTFIAIIVLGLSASARAEETSVSTIPAGYQIAAEDVLDISVWREPDLTKQVVVRPDGGISLPLAGSVNAMGLTTSELEESIRTKLAAYIPDAVVTVSIVQLRGLRVYVTGQVRRPGQFEVGRYIDVLQAITLAGGFTPFADVSNIQVLRRQGGKEERFEFNYKQVERGKNLDQNIQLTTDDVVVVP